MIRGRARVTTLAIKCGSNGAARGPAKAVPQAKSRGCFVCPFAALRACLDQYRDNLSQVAKEWRSSSIAPRSSIPSGRRYPRQSKGMTHETRYRDSRPAVRSGGSDLPSSRDARVENWRETKRPKRAASEAARGASGPIDVSIRASVLNREARKSIEHKRYSATSCDGRAFLKCSVTTRNKATSYRSATANQVTHCRNDFQNPCCTTGILSSQD